MSDSKESLQRWHPFWTWSVRLSCVPWFLGSAALVALRGTTNWIPLAVVFFACWIGLALALSGLFGLLAIRQHEAEERMPWAPSTFLFGVAGLIGSMVVGAVSVVMLSGIEDP